MDYKRKAFGCWPKRCRLESDVNPSAIVFPKEFCVRKSLQNRQQHAIVAGASVDVGGTALYMV